MSSVTKAISVKDLKELIPETDSKMSLTTEDLFKLVNEKFNLVATKSAMLKLLRSEGYSVAQNRCYNAYLNIQKAIDDKKTKIAEDITK